ncbi:Acidic leucine-rich nuclear phosphoprotein 32 family member E [Cricetulus griseus]|uniref:Acidic leucine-rich nuclear phosphoprotein 32 family member n=1 Tax=Cricetulus griseus TaxID=10029 RepID=G3IJ06_CRIGR|nr:Acidic leucine-rich nuclear phosphoprotein 32 family member E [Cricetulus griseus]
MKEPRPKAEDLEISVIESIFELLQQITYLDGFNQEDNEAPDSEEEEGDEDENGDEDEEDKEEDEAGPPEVYDDDDDDDEEEEEEEEKEDEASSEVGEGEEEVGLSYIMKEEIQDDEDDGDYVDEGKEEEEERERFFGERKGSEMLKRMERKMMTRSLKDEVV